MKLFPYQLETAEWASKLRAACIYLDMGLGKTAIAIKVCDLINAKDVLVVCRAVGRENWRREFEKFSKVARDINVLYSSSEFNRRDGVTICSYDGLRRLFEHDSLPFDCVIIDEAHYGKEPNSARTKRVFGTTGAVRRGKKTLLLTGTPTPNHAGELWTTLYTLGRTKLTYDEFLERYCTSRITSHGRQVTGTKTGELELTELRAMLKPIAKRLTKEDVNLELPPISFHDIVVPPGPVELIHCASFQRYVVPYPRLQDLENLLMKEIGVVQSIVNGAFTDEAIRGLEANAKSIMTLRRYNSVQKVEEVVKLVSEELDSKEYEKIVIFALYRDTIEALQVKLKKYGAVLIYGGTKPEKLMARVDAFQNSDKCKVLVAQIQAAGTSLTLTSAHQAMFVDLDWVPGNNAQAAARCHRIGQTKPVTVRCVSLTNNAIDEHITKILARKTREINLLTSLAMPGQAGKQNLNDIL